MKVKLSLFVAFFAIIAFTSCEDNPLEGSFVDETGVGAGNNNVTDTFFANVDGAEFVETAINVSTIDNGTIEYISIAAVKTSTEFLGLSIPTSHGVGTYSFTEFLEAGSVSGSYIVGGSAKPAFPGTLTITEKTATKITGNFSFTAAPFVAGGITYIITEGAFSINY